MKNLLVKLFRVVTRLHRWMGEIEGVPIVRVRGSGHAENALRLYFEYPDCQGHDYYGGRSSIPRRPGLTEDEQCSLMDVMMHREELRSRIGSFGWLCLMELHTPGNRLTTPGDVAKIAMKKDVHANQVERALARAYNIASRHLGYDDSDDWKRR